MNAIDIDDRLLARAPLDVVVEHVLARYHAVHRAQFPEMLRLARKVERVHADAPGCPAGIADHVAAMAQELESHMRKEEGVLFPLILRGRGAVAAAPIAVMRMEHEEHGEALAGLARLTGGLVAPPGACTTWRALYDALRTFRDDLLHHIDIENDILFARAVRDGKN